MHATHLSEMRYFLMTWNPDSQGTELSLDEARRHLKKYPRFETSWSSGNRMNLPPGSRLYFLRQGLSERGIVASGYSIEPPVPEPHWNEEKYRKGRLSPEVRCELDFVMAPHKPFPRKQLNHSPFLGMHWDAESSGTEIPRKIGVALDLAWERHLKVRLDVEINAEIAHARFWGKPDPKIERDAVEIVTKLMKAEGWKVHSVEKLRIGYDLHCTKPRRELHVEVKGSSALIPTFTLTRNEFRRAQIDKNWKLYVVTHLRTDKEMIHEWHGSELDKCFTLEPLSYAVTPKVSKGKRRVP